LTREVGGSTKRGMRMTIAGFVLAVLSAGGCAEDTRVPCAEAYDHLAEIAERRPDVDQKRRFVEACVAAWDETRVRCLIEAETPDVALQCRPRRVRPG